MKFCPNYDLLAQYGKDKKIVWDSRTNNRFCPKIMVISKKKSSPKFINSNYFLQLIVVTALKFLTLPKFFISLPKKFWFCPNIFLALPEKFQFCPNLRNLGGQLPPAPRQVRLWWGEWGSCLGPPLENSTYSFISLQMFFRDRYEVGTKSGKYKIDSRWRPFFFLEITMILGEKSERRDQSAFSCLENINFRKSLPLAPKFEYPPLTICRRIEKIADDINDQLVTNMRGDEFNSQLDEATVSIQIRAPGLDWWKKSAIDSERRTWSTVDLPVLKPASRVKGCYVVWENKWVVLKPFFRRVWRYRRWERWGDMRKRMGMIVDCFQADGKVLVDQERLKICRRKCSADCGRWVTSG